MTEVSEEDLLAIYRLYPRKVDRSDGLKVLRKSVKTAKDLEECQMAVKAFARFCAGQDPKFIRHFGRWARSWRDWLEVEQPKVMAAGTSPRPIYQPPVVKEPVPAAEVARLGMELANKLRGGS